MKSSTLWLCGLMAWLPALASAVETPQSRTITLVRHGHYLADPQADATLGPGISPLGVAQSKLLGARLAALPYRFDKVYASPLTRARETAAVLAPELRGRSIDVLPGLAECTPPTWRADIVADESEAAMTECAEQLNTVFKTLFVPAPGLAQHDLLVCHGNVIRYLLTKAMRVDSKAWLEMSVGHTSINTIRIEADGSFKVISAGDVGHLPANMLTGASGDAELDLGVPSTR